MRFFLDTEINEFGGDLISLALVREDNESLYLVFPEPECGYGPWVKENVVPYIKSIPCPLPGMMYEVENLGEAAVRIQNYFGTDNQIIIVCDWPDDIAYFCKAIMTGPGQMINIGNIIFHMVQIDAYPTTLDDAVPNNSYWDAVTLKVNFCNG